MEECLVLAEELAERLEGARDQLLVAGARDAGFPVKVTGVEIDIAVKHLRTMEEEMPGVRGKNPYGTVAAIFPYDAPAVMMARLGGAALVSGNRLRFSFSSWTPRTAEILARMTKDLDPFEPVTSLDNRRFGRRCVEDDRVRVLFISGASQVGRAYREAKEAFDKVFFAGPGGMPAAFVLPDADPDLASSFIATRAFLNGGQYCTTLKKALVHRSLFDRLKALILEQTRSLHVGDPLDESTDIGPIKLERTRLLMQRAVQELSSCTRLTGSIDGEWIRPFLLQAHGMDLPDLELFGPLLVLVPYDRVQDALRHLLSTRYGFLVACFGGVTSEVQMPLNDHFGMVHVNPDFTFTPLRWPFGGKGESGWILERGGNGWIERDGAFVYSRELVH